MEKSEKEGFIRLPLSPDYHNRPLQKVDFEQGKMAVTRYEIQETGKRIIQEKERPFTHRTVNKNILSATIVKTPTLKDDESFISI